MQLSAPITLIGLYNTAYGLVHTIPDHVGSGPIDVAYAGGQIDSLNITPGPNDTVWEWWVFQVIPHDPRSDQTLGVNFVICGADAAPEFGFSRACWRAR
jgi:hypothetical protein